jgi:pimeloyl-ACP methyl ester carboxylesterase
MLTEFDLTDGPVPLRVTAGPASGPPLVLLHGVGRKGADFLPLVPALATRWHLHLIDHRGHGGSGRATDKYHVLDHADDALAVLAWLGRPAVLFGHSLGALVAAAAAAKRPELVRAVILEDPPSAGYLTGFSNTPYYPTFVAMRRLAGPGKDVAAVAGELGETFVPTPDGTKTVRLADVRDACSLRFIARCLADVDGDVFAPALEGRWMTGYDEHAVWRGLTCPVLLLRGDPAAGGMLPAADAEVMSSLVPGLTRIDFPGVGHLVHGTATELTVRHVLNFLESV